MDKTVVTVECYPGTDQAEILALFPHAELIIHADDLAIQPAELDAKIEHELTDDPVFGIMTTWQMKNFYPEEALCAARGKIDAVTDGLVLVYGVGASLVERTGMDLLQAAAQYHLGSFGVVFIAVTLALFSFSTFIGILFYARSNVAYLFGDRWGWQTAYKVLALVMLMVGGMEAYTVVWDLGDVGIGLMTIFNLIALYPMSGEAITALRDYERRKHLTQN